MKKFDINKAREGAAVCTRKGKEVRILCYDMRHLDRDMLVVLVKQNSGEEYLRMYNPSGVCVEGGPDEDLMMATVKKTLWFNLYTDGEAFYPGDFFYESKELAEANAKSKLEFVEVKSIEMEVEM